MELKKNPKRGRIIGENQKDKNKTGRRGQKSEEEELDLATAF